MKKIKKEELYIRQGVLTDLIFTENSIFFDIETTGFSPVSSSLYLIGCMYRQGQNLVIEQFLAEKKEEETQLIEAFLTLLNSFNTIISFNGVGFDLPFIKAKCDRYKLNEHFKDFQYIDIFKLVGEIKFLLKLGNYKQKTIESFLGIARDDMYSGGELINVYEEYVKNHRKSEEDLLLLHNFEDVTGMLDLLPILSYSQVLHGAYSLKTVEIAPFTSYDGETREECIITLENDYPVPRRVSFEHQGFYFTINKEVTKLRVPLYTGELKYFYPDYKDYFYLPMEDMAVHKSVATFVEKGYRERAKACNCYSRKSGTFLPQLDSIMKPFFKQDYKDKITYFELTDDFLNSDIMLRRYVDHIFSASLSKKLK